jgi:hypothetical protein
MSKLSKKNENLEREENAALAAKIDTLTVKMEAYQKAFDESFAEIEDIKDHAKKIVKLRGLNSELYWAERAIDRKRDGIFTEQRRLISIRADRSTKTRRKTIARMVGIVPTIGYTVIVAERLSQKSLREEEQKLKELIDGAFEQIDIGTFRKTLADSRERITTMLDEAVKNCDLKEISKSQHFSDALHSHGPLKQRFDAVAIARAALGEEEQQTPAADSTPAQPGARQPASHKFNPIVF